MEGEDLRLSPRSESELRIEKRLDRYIFIANN